MVFVNLKSLVEKLNQTCHSSLEAAAEFCRVRTHYQVEVEHWLLKLSERPNTDLTAILQDSGVDLTRWRENLVKRIDRFKTGSIRSPALSPHVVDWVRSAWLVSSVDFGSPVIRSGHLLLALLSDESLSAAAPDATEPLTRISPVALCTEFSEITANTCETAAE
ncbi:MAG: hypothetical protein JXB10_14540 [Pirellulales bacterium]|nr:hypothetical protein [Pirellulales bacterium]